jgi:integrase
MITEPTDRELADFRRWLLRRGRSEGTATLYSYHVLRAYEEGDPVDRLTAELAPKTLHGIAAALKSWARFNKDPELELELADVSLPPAARVKEKKAIPREAWLALIDEVGEADYIAEPVRGVLGLMACRGFRSGDVLRVTGAQTASAFKTGTLVFVAKGRRRLSFPLSPRWQPYLELCAPRKGRQVWQDIAPQRSSAAKTVARALSACASEVGIDEIHPHKLRGTYATYYYQACQDPVKLKDHMQWQSIETAMLYVATAGQKELEAVADTLFDQ